MTLQNSGNKVRFPLALMVGVGAGFFAVSIVPGGTFFIGGVVLGSIAALWLFHWIDLLLGTPRAEWQGEDHHPLP